MLAIEVVLMQSVIGGEVGVEDFVGRDIVLKDPVSDGIECVWWCVRVPFAVPFVQGGRGQVPFVVVEFQFQGAVLFQSVLFQVVPLKAVVFQWWCHGLRTWSVCLEYRLEMARLTAPTLSKRRPRSRYKVVTLFGYTSYAV